MRSFLSPFVYEEFQLFIFFIPFFSFNHDNENFIGKKKKRSRVRKTKLQRQKPEKEVNKQQQREKFYIPQTILSSYVTRTSIHCACY